MLIRHPIPPLTKPPTQTAGLVEVEVLARGQNTLVFVDVDAALTSMLDLDQDFTLLPANSEFHQVTRVMVPDDTLQRLGLTDEQVRAIQSRTFEGFSDPELSMFQLAHKAAADPKSLTGEDYAKLTEQGVSYETILEILAGVCDCGRGGGALPRTLLAGSC